MFSDLQENKKLRLVRCFVQDDEVDSKALICNILESRMLANGDSAVVIEASQRVTIEKLIQRPDCEYLEAYTNEVIVCPNLENVQENEILSDAPRVSLLAAFFAYGTLA